MPGGTTRILLLQKIYWGTAIFSIIFIGAFLAALYRSGKKKHPVIIGFLATSWFTAWIALLPFFGNVWEFSVPRPLSRGNVAAGPPRTICNINAVLLAYLWTVIPGFGLVFVLEVLRMLIEFIQLSRSIDREESSGFMPKMRKKASIDSQSSFESKSDGGDSFSTGDILNGMGSHEQSLLHKDTFYNNLNKAFKTHWQKMVTCLPLVTSLPCLFMIISLQAGMGWRYVHADQFACYAPDHFFRRRKAIILLCHLASTAVIGSICMVTYFILRQKTATGFYRRIRYPLIIRLSALSALSGIGAALTFSIEFVKFNRGIHAFLPPMYLISFPLIGAMLFVDKTTIDEWKSWLTWRKK